MKTIRRSVYFLFCVQLLCITSIHAGYELRRTSVNRGGANGASAGGYQLGMSLGQHASGSSASGVYTLAAGFWTTPPDSIVCVELTIPNSVLHDCSEFEVPITVAGFTDITGLELHITFDASVVSFDSVSSGVLNGVSSSTVGDEIIVLWYDPLLNPVNAQDGDTILFMYFQNLADSTSLSFLSSSEIVNVSGVSQPLCLNHGSVACVPAPTTLTLAHTAGSCGAPFEVPIVVAGFSDVVGVELHIDLDTLVAVFDTVASSVLSDLGSSVADGAINILWYDPMVTPHSLPDGDTLLTLLFTLVTDSTDLTFAAGCELVDVDGQPLGLALVDGSLSCNPQCDSLFLSAEFISAPLCDSCDAVLPVVTANCEDIKGGTIPLAIPEGVSVCSLSTAGLITDDWEFNIDTIATDYVLMVLANSSGQVIPAGGDTVYNLFYHYSWPACTTDTFIPWDTTLSDDPTKALKFTSISYETIHPSFDRDRDSAVIPGYTPGEVTCDCSLDISDLIRLIDYMFRDGVPPCVMDAADVNGDCVLDISDLLKIIDWMFMDQTIVFDCGCIDGAPVAKRTINDNLIVKAQVIGDQTEVSLSTPDDIRGLQLVFVGTGLGAPLLLTGDAVDVVYGVVGDTVKVGILDLDGNAKIKARTKSLLRFDGQYQLVSALVGDDEYVTFAANVDNGSRRSALPTRFALHQNRPNPFNPVTEIAFSLPNASAVHLVVYNILGQEVAVIVNSHLEPGGYSYEWDGSRYSSGVYLYRLEAGTDVETRKMLLLK